MSENSVSRKTVSGQSWTRTPSEDRFLAITVWRRRNIKNYVLLSKLLNISLENKNSGSVVYREMNEECNRFRIPMWTLNQIA